MNVAILALTAALSFGFFALVFRPLEVVFPAKPGQRLFRPAWFTDLCFFLGQYLLWSGLVLVVMTAFKGWLDAVVPRGFRQTVAWQPWWLQVLEVILLSDFLIYWGHRLQHRVGILWRFHKVHHSAEHLDWLAAHREHPLDTIYTIGIVNLPALVLGFPIETIAGFIAFRGLWAIYIHSNVRLPLGPLRVLLGAPELHHWHHARDRHAGNYANLSPLMDVIFGTYHCPDHQPACFGLNEPTPRSYLGQLLEPLLPRPLARRWFRGASTGSLSEAIPWFWLIFRHRSRCRLNDLAPAPSTACERTPPPPPGFSPSRSCHPPQPADRPTSPSARSTASTLPPSRPAVR